MTTTKGKLEQLAYDFHRRIFDEGDLDAVDELLADDYIEHNPFFPNGPVGREEMIEAWEGVNAAFPDCTNAVEFTVAQDDLVASRHIVRGTHEGEFLGIEPTGIEVEVKGIDILRIEDGKIVEGWLGTDTLGWMQQVGAVEPPEP